MSIRHWALVTALTGGVAAATFLAIGSPTRAPAPVAMQQAASWSPPLLDTPRVTDAPLLPILARMTRGQVNPVVPTLPVMPTVDSEPAAVGPPIVTWSRAIAAGETLDAVLADA